MVHSPTCIVLLSSVGLLVLVPIAPLLLLVLPVTIVVGLPWGVLCNFLWAVVSIMYCLTTVEASLPNRGARSTSLHLRARKCILTVLGDARTLTHLIRVLERILVLVLVKALILILPLLHPSALLWPLWHGQARASAATRLPWAVELPLAVFQLTTLVLKNKRLVYHLLKTGEGVSYQLILQSSIQTLQEVLLLLLIISHFLRSIS